MKTNFISRGIASLLLVCPSLVWGSDFSYDYVQMGIGTYTFEVDGTSGSLDGNIVELEAQASIQEDFFLNLTYQTISLDGDASIDYLAFGIGTHRALQDNLDVVGSLSNVSFDFEAPGFSDDASELQLSLGLRYQANERIETDTTLKLLAPFEDNTTTVFDLVGLYKFTRSVSIGLGLQFESDDDSDARTLYIPVRVYAK